MLTTRALVPVVLATTALLAACGGKTDEQEDSAAAANATVSPTGAASDTNVPAPATAAAPGATGSLTDPNIVYILDQANAADSARGQLAQRRATNADVKSYGQLMVGEHHALRAQGQALAKKLGVTPQAPANDQSQAQAKQEMDSLTAMAKGAAWDKAYIDYEVTYHQAVLQTAQQALAAAQNQELKDLIQKAAPIIQHHLDRAQEIQRKLGSS